MGAAAGRADLESLRKEAARLREENGCLEKQNRQTEKEILQMKAQGAQAQARNVPARPAGSFRLYSAIFPEPMDPAGLRACADGIRRGDPEAIIFLCDPQGFCVAASGGAARMKGITAQEMLKLSTGVAGGSGGGRPELAQGRLREPGRFDEVRRRLEQLIQERSR